MNLTWQEFQNSTSKAFQNLQGDENFADVTLVSGGGKQMKVHKVILSSCSPFFKNILIQNPHQHPLIYLKGVDKETLKSLMKFIYSGEVEIPSEGIVKFLEAANDLEIDGLLQKFPIDPQKRKKNEDERSDCNDGDDDYGVKEEIKDNNAMYHEVFDSQGGDDENLDTDDMTAKALDALGEQDGQDEQQGGSSVVSYDNYSQIEPIQYMTEYGDGEIEDQDQGEEVDHSYLEEKLDALTERRSGIWHCLECGKTDDKRFHLRRHAETHLKGFSHSCPVCTKSFKTRANMKQHVFNSHKTEKLDLIGHCSPPKIKKVKENSRSNSNMFPCDMCSKNCPTKNALRVHKFRKHYDD